MDVCRAQTLCGQFSVLGRVDSRKFAATWLPPAGAEPPCRRRWRQCEVANRRLLCKAVSEDDSRSAVSARGGNDEYSAKLFVADTEGQSQAGNEIAEIDCVGTGSDVECFVPDSEAGKPWLASESQEEESSNAVQSMLDTLLLISPFFFWGTAMVAMKDVLPKAGPLFVSSFRLLPSGALLVAFALSKGRKLPDTPIAWLTILVFAIVDGSCFQGFLSEGLRRTSAGLGSVIIDSQPLTVAVLAAIFFGESIGTLGIVGLITGVVGLCLLELPVEAVESFLNSQQMPTQFLGDTDPTAPFSLWDSGEWWMLLAAQSMAVGTVLVRWVCRYNDPIMATGWHMILGGIPLLLLSVQVPDPVFTGHIGDLSSLDWSALLYTSIFGSAVSYGVFFYNASKGNLTRLSSLTFLTPMFAAVFGYLYLGETLSPWQLVGALVTVVAITLVNTNSLDKPTAGKNN